MRFSLKALAIGLLLSRRLGAPAPGVRIHRIERLSMMIASKDASSPQCRVGAMPVSEKSSISFRRSIATASIHPERTRLPRFPPSPSTTDRRQNGLSQTAHTAGFLSTRAQSSILGGVTVEDLIQPFANLCSLPLVNRRANRDQMAARLIAGCSRTSEAARLMFKVSKQQPCFSPSRQLISLPPI